MAYTTHPIDPEMLEASLVLDNDALCSAPPCGNVLSNGRLTSVVVSTGATRMSFDGIAVSRWNRFDATGSGSVRMYVRDLDSGEVWQIAAGADRRVVMQPGGVRFERRLNDELTARMDVFVAEDTDLEVRRITLRNDGKSRRRIDITSCIQAALVPIGTPADDSIPLSASFDQNREAIVIRALVGEASEHPPHLVHTSRGSGTFTGFETSHVEFFGSNGEEGTPVGLEPGRRLTGTAGESKGAVAVIQRTLDVSPGIEASVVVYTGTARSEADALALLRQVESFSVDDELRASAAVELQRQLLGKIEPQQARYFRNLGTALFIDDVRLRAPEDLAARASAPESRLEELGIDPSIPLAVVRVSGEDEIPVVRSMLKAHRYWRTLGLSANLFILNDVSDTGDAETLQALIERATDANETPVHVRGGVFTEYADDMLVEDQLLLQKHASILIRGELPAL
jgi:cyclic beta-1,2-glucan synthetase